MADFSTKATDMNTVIEPSAVIVNPVDRSNELAGLENIGRGIAQGAGVLGSFMKSRSEADTSKVLANFSIQLNDLQDAFDQGSISSSEYGMRRRALLKQKLADAPNLEEDFLKRYSTFREQNGLSAVDSPGVQQAKIRQDAVNAAVDNGFLPISQVGNQQAEETALQNLEKFNTSARQLKEESDRIALESSKLELGSKKRADKEAEGKAVVLEGLAKIGRDATPYWRTQYENIKTRAAQASNEMERRQIISDGIMKMDQDYAQRAASISGDTLNIDQGRIDQVLKPQADLIAAYKKELNGEYDTDTFNRYVDAATARAKAMAMQGLDENTKQWIAVSEIAKSAPGAFNQQILTGVTAAFGKNANVTVNGDGSISAKPADLLPTGETETKDVRNYLETLTGVIEDSMKDRFKSKSPEEKAAMDSEIRVQMNAIFKGVDVHSNSVQSAKEFQPVIDFFSNPIIGEYLRGEGIDPSLRADVAKVMQNGYAAQVVPMLRDSYDQMIEKKPGTLGASSAIDGGNLTPSLESGKFVFKWSGESEPTYGEKARIREMNNSPFVKVLNKMMITDANIRGDGDVQKSWEETYKPSIFPDEQGDTGGETTQSAAKAGEAYVDPMVVTTNSNNADFTLDDVAESVIDSDLEISDAIEASGGDVTTLSGDLKEVARAIDIGETGTGDYNTLFGHSNRSGKTFSNANITDKTVDELLNFSSARGEYGSWTKGQLGYLATPMGRYQIVGKTLRKLKNELGLDGSEKFTPELQDRMFMQLLKGRGYLKYKNGEITKEQFLSNMKNEWEGLAKNRKSAATLAAAV